MRKTHSTLLVLAAGTISASAVTVWQAGAPGRGWPLDGVGGGPDVDFIQEAGVNALPGSPNSPLINQQSDDDYYFAGVYTTQVDGGPAYSPVGVVPADELGAERAFANIDNSLRYHFNLPATVSSTDLLSVSWEANNLDQRAENADPRYGVEIYFNGNLVGVETIVRPVDLNVVFTTPQFTLADVNAQIGPGFDNYVELRGINYNASGGGNWMGSDYVALDATPIPEPRSAVLLILGSMISLAFLRRRKSR